MSYPGIDYGHGQTNIDHTNGIRYGVISQHSVLQTWADNSEAEYGDPHCPKCGGNAVDIVDVDCEDWPKLYSHSLEEYACENCEVTLDSSDVYGEEPLGFSYHDDDYIASSCLDSDIMIIKSPYYTFAQFCSPCCPGAGNLDNAMPEGAKTYCFGHDWFDDEKAPYPVYSVADDTEVKP